MTRFLFILVLMSACTDAELEPVALDPAERLVDDAPRFLADRAFRRDALERSLWRPELPYAETRLDAYALERGGWDALPGTLGAELVSHTPVSRDGWESLGEQVFWELPMRWDGYLAWVAGQPELWDELGFESDGNGLRGVVTFVDSRGVQRTGLTCGACHGAGGVAGRPNRRLDLGRARALFLESRGLPTAPFDAWGPGRVDVTDDGVDDPLTFPTLFGVAHHSNMNRSGAIDIEGNPAAIAVRFETQFIEGHAFGVRPDRRLPLALAIFVLSLSRDAKLPDMASPDADVFAARCGGCHAPDRGLSGGLVPADALVGDATAAHSTWRGTGFYKVPSLLGVADGGPYLHDGGAADLPALLDAGHPFGAKLSETDRAAVLRFLSTLRSLP